MSETAKPLSEVERETLYRAGYQDGFRDGGGEYKRVREGNGILGATIAERDARIAELREACESLLGPSAMGLHGGYVGTLYRDFAAAAVAKAREVLKRAKGEAVAP